MVDDYGIEVLKKAGVDIDGAKNNYAIQTVDVGGFGTPLLCDAIVPSYPNNTTEVYAYKQGGVSGTVLQTVTVTYTDSSKTLLASVVKS